MWLVDTIRKYANIGATASLATTNTLLAGSQTAVARTSGAAAGGLAAAGTALGAFGVAAAPAIPIVLALGFAILMATPALYVLGEVIKSLATVIGNVLMKALEMLPAIISSIAAGFVTVFSTLAANWKVLIPVALGVTALAFSFGALSLSLLALGVAGLIAAPGLMVVSILMLSVGASIAMMGNGIKNASEGVISLVKNLQQVKPVISNLYTLAKALDNVGDSMSRLSKIGAIALPLLLASGISTASPKQVEGQKPTTAATTAIAPAPVGKIQSPPATAAAPQPAQQALPAAKQESSGEIKALLDKMDQLIGVLRAGGTINMDGKKVADIVQRNIRTVKFAD